MSIRQHHANLNRLGYEGSEVRENARRGGDFAFHAMSEVLAARTENFNRNQHRTTRRNEPAVLDFALDDIYAGAYHADVKPDTWDPINGIVGDCRHGISSKAYSLTDAEFNERSWSQGHSTIRSLLGT